MNMRNTTDEFELSVIQKDNPNLDKLLSVYPEEAIKKILDNKDKVAKVLQAFSANTVNVTLIGMVMTCAEKCPYSTVCILLKNDLAPFGYPCPIERKVAIDLEQEVITSLEIDSSDPIEMEMLWDLIDMKLLDMRSSGALRDGLLTQLVESKVGQSVQTKKEISSELEIKLDIKRLKHSIIDTFVATRRAKKKYGMNTSKNNLEEILRNASQTVTSDDLTDD